MNFIRLRVSEILLVNCIISLLLDGSLLCKSILHNNRFSDFNARKSSKPEEDYKFNNRPSLLYSIVKIIDVTREKSMQSSIFNPKIGFECCMYSTTLDKMHFLKDKLKLLLLLFLMCCSALMMIVMSECIRFQR